MHEAAMLIASLIKLKLFSASFSCSWRVLTSLKVCYPSISHYLLRRGLDKLLYSSYASCAQRASGSLSVSQTST